MYLIVGLGNPGRRYRKTRHNVGFLLLDRMAARFGQAVECLSGRSLVCPVELVRRKVLLAKPQTFMNRSGHAVRELVLRGGFELSQCVIVYDEITLPLGKIRLRPSGSAGGHKGMQSIIDLLGTEQIPRLRIGISGAPSGVDISDYVLSKFEKEELDAVDEVLGRCCSLLEVCLAEGIDRAMALYN